MEVFPKEWRGWKKRFAKAQGCCIQFGILNKRIDPTSDLSIVLSVCLYIQLSVCLLHPLEAAYRISCLSVYSSMSVCLLFFLSIQLFRYLCIYQSIDLSSAYSSLSQPIYGIYPSVEVLLCPSVYPPLQPIRPSIHLRDPSIHKRCSSTLWISRSVWLPVDYRSYPVIHIGSQIIGFVAPARDLLRRTCKFR